MDAFVCAICNEAPCTCGDTSPVVRPFKWRSREARRVILAGNIKILLDREAGQVVVSAPPRTPVRIVNTP